jgi:Trypsin-like peptidase domain
VSQEKLPSLPGTAPDGSWRIGTIDRDPADGRVAICAIVARPAASEVNLRGYVGGTLIGTAFFVIKDGGFATAKHVALEAQHSMSQAENSVGLVYTLSNGLSVFRPIWRFAIHPTADLAFGIPHEIIDNTTGAAFQSKSLSLEPSSPGVGAAISTWAYPLHKKETAEEGGEALHFQPDFYNGVLNELYDVRGPSAKLNVPYYLTSIHLHGGSSGGPVFNERGHVFGIASCSYEGAEDVAFVTPIDSFFEIEISNVNLKDGHGPRCVTVGQLARLGQIAMWNAPNLR